MKLQRLLIVCEPGKDGVFDYAKDLIAHTYQQHPNVVVDLAYSSKRGSTGLEKLVKEIESPTLIVTAEGVKLKF